MCCVGVAFFWVMSNLLVSLSKNVKSLTVFHWKAGNTGLKMHISLERTEHFYENEYSRDTDLGVWVEK